MIHHDELGDLQQQAARRDIRLACETCIYCNRTNAGPTTAAECRRLSPNADNGFPRVWPYDWCGEHRFRKEPS